MNRKPEHLTYRLLRSMKIPVSKTFLKQQMLSHPDYPYIVCITDILDELNIENGAFAVDKEKLHEIPVPFLAHIAAKGGEFELITDLKRHLKNNPDFENRWDGVAVVAGKPIHFANSENEKIHKQEKKSRQSLWFFIIVIAGLSFYSLGINFSWQYTGLLLTTLTGLSVAVLIVQHELGISNEFTEQLCSAGKNTDCDTVMHQKTTGSKSSSFLHWLNSFGIGLADATIIYFGSVFIVVTASLFSGNIQSFMLVFFLLATLSLPLTLFSIYYQWWVVKKWCPLCLATVAVLWMQFALTFGAELAEATKGILSVFSWNETLFTIFTLSAVTALWQLLIKPALQKNKELTDKNFSLLRFKNNPDVFNALLLQQRKVDTTPFEHDLQLGNPDAGLQIMVASNPYCGPCARVHHELDQLLIKNDIGLTLRFPIKTEKKDDKKLQTVQYLLQLTKGKPNDYKRKILNDWYTEKNFEKFRRKYFTREDINADELLKQNEQWSDENKIEFTPTIFINGKKIPKQFQAGDLRTILRNSNKAEEENEEKYLNENELIPV